MSALPRECRDLGGEDRVLRVLRTPVRAKRLGRLGYGWAAPSSPSPEPLLYL
jgi:hypothetical protein